MDDDANGIHINSFFEDEYSEDFKRPKGQKKNFKHQKFHRYHNTHSETARWEDEDDNHLIRPKEKKNIFKDLRFLKKPTSAVNRSNSYKDIEFDILQNTAGPSVDKSAVGNTTKLDASKLAPFEKDFYQLHPDTKHFTDVSIQLLVLLLSSVGRYFSAKKSCISVNLLYSDTCRSHSHKSVKQLILLVSYWHF